MPTITVTSFTPDHDMRATTRDRAHATDTLGAGQGHLYINRRHTMGRLIDHMGGVHTYWASPGYEFDLPSLIAAFNDGVGLQIAVATPGTPSASTVTRLPQPRRTRRAKAA